MENAIILIVLVVVIGAAAIYIIREKKKGVACIGCPAAGRCANNHSGSGCSGQSEEKHSYCGYHNESE